MNIAKDTSTEEMVTIRTEMVITEGMITTAIINTKITIEEEIEIMIMMDTIIRINVHAINYDLYFMFVNMVWEEFFNNFEIIVFSNSKVRTLYYKH